MTAPATFQTARALLRKAEAAYHDDRDDVACARLLFEAIMAGFQELAAEMGYPCNDREEARQFCKVLDKGNELMGHYDGTLNFGITMLEHSEGADWTEDDEFAWHFDEFPLAIAVTGRQPGLASSQDAGRLAMARVARHIELAVRYLQTSATLQNGGFNNEAAEMVWGAVVNAIESIGHIDAGNERRNLNNRARRDLARDLPPTTFRQYHDAQTKLHAHFYHDLLNEEEFHVYIARGRAYAQQIIQIARRRQPGGSLPR